MAFLYSNKYVKFTLCHQIPSRSFYYKGKQFPLCARCTGLTIGVLTYPFFSVGIIYLDLWLILLFHIPMILDGGIQIFTKYEAKNWWRFITGILAGIAQAGLIQHAAKLIASAIILLDFI